MELTALLTRRTAEDGSLAVWRRMHVPVLLLTSVLAVAVAVLGWLAIPVLLGPDFTAGREVLPVLCAAAVPYASYHLDTAARAGLRDLRSGAVGALVGCGALCVATVAGYWVLGTVGIAYGVLVTYLVMAVTVRALMTRGRNARPPGAQPSAPLGR